MNVRGLSEVSPEYFPLETCVRICRREVSLCHWVGEATQGSACLTTIQVIWLKLGCGQSSCCLTRTTIRITWWLIASACDDSPSRGSDREEHSVRWLGEGTRLVWNHSGEGFWAYVETYGEEMGRRNSEWVKGWKRNRSAITRRNQWAAQSTGPAVDSLIPWGGCSDLSTVCPGFRKTRGPSRVQTGDM